VRLELDHHHHQRDEHRQRQPMLALEWLDVDQFFIGASASLVRLRYFDRRRPPRKELPPAEEEIGNECHHHVRQ
jgi:hypothetical protein